MYMSCNQWSLNQTARSLTSFIAHPQGFNIYEDSLQMWPVKLCTGSNIMRFFIRELICLLQLVLTWHVGMGEGGQGRVCQQDVGRAEWANKDVSWGCQHPCQSSLDQISALPPHSCHISHFPFTFHTNSILKEMLKNILEMLCWLIIARLNTNNPLDETWLQH